MEPTDPQLLLEALIFFRENFISSAYSTMVFTVVAAGWLITSKSAQEFIRARRWLGLSSIVMIVVSYVMYWRMALGVQDSSYAIAQVLKIYYEEIVYQHYELSLNGVYGFVIIQGLASVFIVLLILSIIYAPTKAEPTND